MNGCIHVIKNRDDTLSHHTLLGYHLAHVHKKYPQILAGTVATIFVYQSPW